MPKETPEEKVIREAKEAEDKLAAEIEEQRLAKEAEAKAELEQLDLISKEEQLAKEAEGKAAAELENAPKSISLKGVVLKGTAPQMKGSHSIHFNATTNVVFIEGIANVSETLAEQLKSAGYIE